MTLYAALKKVLSTKDTPDIIMFITLYGYFIWLPIIYYTTSGHIPHDSAFFLASSFIYIVIMSVITIVTFFIQGLYKFLHEIYIAYKEG